MRSRPFSKLDAIVVFDPGAVAAHALDPILKNHRANMIIADTSSRDRLLQEDFASLCNEYETELLQPANHAAFIPASRCTCWILPAPEEYSAIAAEISFHGVHAAIDLSQKQRHSVSAMNRHRVSLMRRNDSVVYIPHAAQPRRFAVEQSGALSFWHSGETFFPEKMTTAHRR
jgi:hypothetical protein